MGHVCTNSAQRRHGGSKRACHEGRALLFSACVQLAPAPWRAFSAQTCRDLAQRRRKPPGYIGKGRRANGAGHKPAGQARSARSTYHEVRPARNGREAAFCDRQPAASERPIPVSHVRPSMSAACTVLFSQKKQQTEIQSQNLYAYCDDFSTYGISSQSFTIQGVEEPDQRAWARAGECDGALPSEAMEAPPPPDEAGNYDTLVPAPPAPVAPPDPHAHSANAASTPTAAEGGAGAAHGPAAAPQAASSRVDARVRDQSLDEKFLVMLWLKKQGFLQTYDLVKQESRLNRRVEDIAQVLNSEPFNHMGKCWLRAQGYRDRELANEYYAMFPNHPEQMNPETRALREQFYADNVGLFFGAHVAVHDYVACYQRLRTFVTTCKPVYREELRPLLFPVLVHLVLELIHKDKDGTKVKAAHQLLDLAAADHSVQHREQYLILRGLFRWEHVTQSSLWRQFAPPYRETSEANTVVLSPNALDLIRWHVREQTLTHHVTILTRIVYLKVNITVRGQCGPVPPRLSLVSDVWEVSSDLTSTYLPAWSLASTKGAMGGRGPGERGTTLLDLPLKDEEMWDAAVGERLANMLDEARRAAELAAVKNTQEALDAARAEAAAAEAAGGVGEEQAAAVAAAEAAAAAASAAVAASAAAGKRKSDEAEEPREESKGGKAKKKKKGKGGEGSAQSGSTVKAKSGAKDSAGPAGAAPAAAHAGRKAVPRPKLEPKLVERLAGMCSQRVTVGARSLPSVCMYTLYNCEDSLTNACVSIDGSILAACLSDSTVSIWNMDPVGTSGGAVGGGAGAASGAGGPGGSGGLGGIGGWSGVARLGRRDGLGDRGGGAAWGQGANDKKVTELWGGGPTSWALGAGQVADADEAARMKRCVGTTLRGHSGAVYAASISLDG